MQRKQSYVFISGHQNAGQNHDVKNLLTGFYETCEEYYAFWSSKPFTF